MLKKILGLTFVFVLAFLFVTASEAPKTTNKTNAKTVVTGKAKKSSHAKKHYCRICCTVTMTNSDGESADATRCAGWLLTSCETAAEKACDKAYDAVSALIP